MDCEDCRHLTVVGLHDTGPRSDVIEAGALTTRPTRWNFNIDRLGVPVVRRPPRERETRGSIPALPGGVIPVTERFVF